MTDYQIFISYRRDGGEDLAGRVSDKLKGLGYHVFYDIESMRSGTFNTQIFTAIEQCEDVLLILPPNGLDRCKDENDWVRLEIEHALKCGKNIVPLMMRGFTYPAVLPPSIDGIQMYESVISHTEYFDAVIQRIVSLLKSPAPGSVPKPNSSQAELTAGVRFLNRKLYPQALACFEKVIQNDISNPEGYFYAAAALLGGKRPFMVTKPTINKIEEYLASAIAFDKNPLYYYFLAYIKYDFHHSKMLKTTPTFQELLYTATSLGISRSQVDSLFELLQVQKPSVF